jgi:hypothetical protein
MFKSNHIASTPARIMFHLFMSVLLCTYVGIRSFRLRLHGLSRLEQICWNMLIEAAHCEKSNLFLQSEPVTEGKRNVERSEKRRKS